MFSSRPFFISIARITGARSCAEACEVLMQAPPKALGRDTALWNAAMQKCVSEGNLTETDKLRGAMLKWGCKQNERTFAILLGNPSLLPSEALAIFNEMKRIDSEQNTHANPRVVGKFSLNQLFRCLAKEGYASEALEIFFDPKIAPCLDLFHVATVITALTRAGFAAKALELFDSMAFESETSRLVPAEGLKSGRGSSLESSGDVKLISAAISACEKLGLVERGVSLYRGLPPSQRDVVSLNAVLACCARGAKGEEASRLFWEGIGGGLQLNRVSVGAVTRAFEAQGRYVDAIKFLQEIPVGLEQEKDRSRPGSAPSSFGSTQPLEVSAQFKEQLCARMERRALRTFSSLHPSSQPERGGVAGERVDFDYSGFLNEAERTKKKVFRDDSAEDSKVSKEMMDDVMLVGNFMRMHLERVGFPVLYGGIGAGLSPSASDDLDVTLIPCPPLPSSAFLASELHESAPSLASLVSSRSSYPPREEAQKHLLDVLKILRRFEKSGEVKIVQTGLGGRVPVVTLEVDVERVRGEGGGQKRRLLVDLTFDNKLGVQKSLFLHHLLSSYPPSLVGAVKEVKLWAKREGLTGQTRGYLSGYTLTIMTLFTARTLKEAAEKRGHHPTELSKSDFFAAFFVLFGRFWTENFAVSLRGEGVRERQGRGGSGRGGGGSSFSVECPVESDWDLGAILGEQRSEELKEKIRKEVEEE